MSMRVHENQLKKNLYRQNKTVAKNLRFLRLVYDYSQQSLADFLHISRSAYYSIESGAKTLDFESLVELAGFYEIDIDYLVSYDICEQLINMIRVDYSKIKATVFLERYFALSRSGKEQIRNQVMEMAEKEKPFNKFPWEYDGFEDVLER